eukprot:Selendium_serpulae@DN6449_c1_g1_i7.p1
MGTSLSFHKLPPVRTQMSPVKTQPLTFEQLAQKIHDSEYCVALTGAGVSAESKIPTFRNPGDGLWNKYDLKMYATSSGNCRYPDKIWELLKDVVTTLDPQPNPSHTAMAKLEEANFLKKIITQNVDNLHQHAGSKRVIEFHGNLMNATCKLCGAKIALTRELLVGMSVKQLVKCQKCGGVMKPDVVLFGDSLPQKAVDRSAEAAQKCDLLLVVGTSATVSPASEIPRQVK